MKEALEVNLEAYRNKLPELMEHQGKYALFHDGNYIDYFDSYEDAVKEAYSKFKLDQFLVKRIEVVEKIEFFSRDLVCPI